jgi:hypothetical protein
MNDRKRKNNNKKFKNLERLTLLAVFLSGVIVVSFFFAWMEEYRLLIAGTDTDSVTVSVNVTETISINAPSDITLMPEIVETGSATGNTTWIVETNNADGWKLELNASVSPAMSNGGNNFADYTETTSGIPESWNIASNSSEFGFSVGGSYAGWEYSDGNLYEGFDGSNKILVAQDSGTTPGGGAEVDVYFKAEVGIDKIQPSGTYTATITATATTL